MAVLIHTKELIFDTSIELFAERGYENVSMRDLAKEVGIKASSIYNHFSGKNALLEYIYAFYKDNMYAGRLPMGELQHIISAGTKEEVLSGLVRVSFLTLPALLSKRLILITKILYARLYSDRRAGNIFWESFESNCAYVTAALDYGIQIGRFHPFDTQGYAFAMTAQYSAVGMISFIKPGYRPGEMQEEARILAFMKELLPFAESSSEIPAKETQKFRE